MKKIKSNQSEEESCVGINGVEGEDNSIKGGLSAIILLLAIITVILVIDLVQQEEREVVMDFNHSSTNLICHKEYSTTSIEILCGDVKILTGGNDVEIMCEDNITLLKGSSFGGLSGNMDIEIPARIAGICGAEELGNYLGICLILTKEEICE